MNGSKWLALAGALGAALLLVGAVRRRVLGSAGGRRFLRHPAATPGVFVLAFFALLALAAPVVAPYDPDWMPGVVEIGRASCRERV